MNKNINKKLFCVLLLLFDLATYSAEPSKESPIEVGSVSFASKSGPAPIVYTSRDSILGVDPRARPVEVVDLGRVSQFSDQFKLPFVVGIELGYALTPYCELFGEFVYKHASGKTVQRRLGGLSTIQVFGNFTAFEGFGGLRLFAYEPWFENVWPFVGFKVGIIHHKRIPVLFKGKAINGIVGYFGAGNVVAEGLQAGFMWELGQGWSFMFTAEMVPAGAAESGKNLKFNDIPLVIHIGDIGTVITFPVSFGLRYDF